MYGIHRVRICPDLEQLVPYGADGTPKLGEGLAWEQPPMPEVLAWMLAQATLRAVA
ncbi:MAG: hypothetical protein GX596_15225 [Propionibacterium sp.]|nr:hypothetical protein [Propionibacterium sp.]